VVILGLRSKLGRSITTEFLELADEAGKWFNKAWQSIRPYVKWMSLIYLLVLLVFLVGHILSSGKTASGFLFVLVIWATIFLAVFTFGAAKKGQPENLRTRLLASYHGFMKRINTLAFLVISMLFLKFYLPEGALADPLKYGVMTLIVIATIYGIIRNYKVIYGLTVLLFLCAAVIGTQVVFTPAQVNTYLAQRVANDDLVRITLTKDTNAYNAQGQKTGIVVQKGTLIYANYNAPLWSIQGGGDAITCTIGSPGGNIYHLYLQKGDNY